LAENIHGCKICVSGRKNPCANKAALSSKIQGSASFQKAVEPSKLTSDTVHNNEYNSDLISLSGENIVHSTSPFGFYKYHAVSWSIDASIFNIYKLEDGCLDVMPPRNQHPARNTSNMACKYVLYSVDLSTEKGKQYELIPMKDKKYGNDRIL
jgi:hypothetical protein